MGVEGQRLASQAAVVVRKRQEDTHGCPRRAPCRCGCGCVPWCHADADFAARTAYHLAVSRRLRRSARDGHRVENNPPERPVTEELRRLRKKRKLTKRNRGLRNSRRPHSPLHTVERGRG